VLQYCDLMRSAGADAIGDFGCQNEPRAQVCCVLYHRDCPGQVCLWVIRHIHLQQGRFHSSCKQSVKLARALKRVQIIASTHMDVANKDLWHGTSTVCAIDHLGLTLWILQDIHFGKGSALFVQEPLGRVTKATQG
jgi:hypothetical protein